MSDYWTRFTATRTSRRRILQGGVAFSSAAALALLGCSSDDADDNAEVEPTANPAGDPKPGGRYAWVPSASNNLNPVTNWAEGHTLSGAQGGVYDRLISSRLVGRNKIIMEAAESMEQPDQLRVVFKLKPDMVFQNFAPVNGRAVKASDIVASQNYTKGQAAAENDFQRNVTESIEAPDDRTVVFRLRRPNAYLFTSSLMTHPGSMAMMPAEILESLDTHRPIGSGPYQATEWTMGSRWHYRRFDGYRDKSKGLPYVDEREALFLPDLVAQEAAFRSEQIHVMTPSPGNADRIISETGRLATKLQILSLSPITFNMFMTPGRGPWTTDARVREAFYRILNRQQIAELVWRGAALVPPGILSVPLEPYQLSKAETDQYFKTDVAAAKQLLSAANYPMDRELSLVQSTSAINNQAAQVAHQQFQSAGINIRINSVTLPEMLAQTQKGDSDLHLGSHPQYDSPGIPLRQAGHRDSRSQFANSGLGDPAIEALIEKSEETVNVDENVKLVKQIQTELLKKYTPYILLVTQNLEQVLNAKIQNYEQEPSASAAGLQRANLWLSA